MFVVIQLLLLCQIASFNLVAAQVIGVFTREKCVNSDNLILNCQPAGVILIREIVLGDSRCFGRNCCPVPSDCTSSASSGHVTHVISSCNGQSSCSIRVEQKGVPCGPLGFSINNDFERIKYECIATTTTSPRPSPTVHLSSSRPAITTTWTAPGGGRLLVPATSPSAPVPTKFSSQQSTSGPRPSIPTSHKSTSRDDESSTPVDQVAAGLGLGLAADPAEKTTTSAAAATLSSSHLVIISVAIMSTFLALIFINVCLWLRLKRRPRYSPKVTLDASSGIISGFEVLPIESLVRPTAVVRATVDSTGNGTACGLTTGSGIGGGDCCGVQTRRGDDCSGCNPPPLPAFRPSCPNQYEKLDCAGVVTGTVTCRPSTEQVFYCAQSPEVDAADGCCQGCDVNVQEVYEDIDEYLKPLNMYDNVVVENCANTASEMDQKVA